MKTIHITEPNQVITPETHPVTEITRFIFDSDQDGDITVSGDFGFWVGASRKGKGKGNAYRDGDGDGGAYRKGEGEGDAYRKGEGEGDAYRDGKGDGSAFREDSGDGGAYRYDDGDGDACRGGEGKGNAFREDSGDGHAIRGGEGYGDAFRYGSGAGAAFREGEGEGGAYRDGDGDGSAYIRGVEKQVSSDDLDAQMGQPVEALDELTEKYTRPTSDGCLLVHRDVVAALGPVVGTFERCRRANLPMSREAVALYEAHDAHGLPEIPVPPLHEQVLALLGDGWKVEHSCMGGYSRVSRRCVFIVILDDANPNTPAQIADALRVLAGEEV